MKEAAEFLVEEDCATTTMGSYGSAVRVLDNAAAEILVMWATNQPEMRKHNSFVRQSAHSLSIDACGHPFSIFQSPSSMGTPGVTGAVIWDSGVVLAKFIEHAVDSKHLLLKGKKVIELGSGCGLVGCVAAVVGADVILTDLHERLKLLKKNVDANVGDLAKARGSARVMELTWGDDLGSEFVEPLPDFVFGSDVIYCEDTVADLLLTLQQLSGRHTTIFLAGELRNDAVLEFFLEAAMKVFQVGYIDPSQWHPEYCSYRVALFVLVKKSDEEVFESHRVVFTVGTSIASILTAWAGYSLRQHHQSNVEKRLESIEKAMTKSYDVEREEIKRIVNTRNISTTACIATAGTSLIIGYGLGWRSGLWFANRKYKREQLKLLGQVKPRGWQTLRSHFVRFGKNQSLAKTLDLPVNAPPTTAPN